MPLPYDNSPRTDKEVKPGVASASLLGLVRKLPEGLSFGTVGWYCPDWRGSVYDAFVGDRPDWFRMYAAYTAHPLFHATEWVLSRNRVTDDRTWERVALLTPADFSLFIRLSGAVTDPVKRARRGTAAGENDSFLSFSLAQERVIEPIEKHFGEKPPIVLLDLLSDPRRDAYRPSARKTFYERLEGFLTLWRESTAVPIVVNVRSPLLQTPALMKLLRQTGAAPSITLSYGGARLSAQLRSLNYFGALPSDVERQAVPLVLRWLAPQVPSHFRGELSGRDPVTATRLAYTVMAALKEKRPVCVLIDERAEGNAPQSVEAFARIVVELRRKWREEEERLARHAPPDLPPLVPSRSEKS